MAYVAGFGALESGIATILKSGEQDKRLKDLKEIANTPGINFSGLTGEALQGYNENYGAASKLASKLSLDQQALLDAQQEAALPGLKATREAALGRIGGLFADDASWLKGVQRRGAALGVGRGLFGSGAGQLQTLHLSDEEQNQRTQLGTGLLGSLIGSLKLTSTPGINAFLGPSISEQLATRSSERSQRIAGLTNTRMLPTGMEQIYEHMQQEGSALEGFGLGGGSFGGGGGPSASSGGNWNTSNFNTGDAQALAIGGYY